MAVRHRPPFSRRAAKLGEDLSTASVGSRSDPRLWPSDTGCRFPAANRSSVRIFLLRPLDRGAIHDYGRPTPAAVSPPCSEARRGSFYCVRWIAERSTTMAVTRCQPLFFALKMTPYFSSSEPRYVARAVRVNAIANSRNATVTANRHVPEIRRSEAETWGLLAVTARR